MEKGSHFHYARGLVRIGVMGQKAHIGRAAKTWWGSRGGAIADHSDPKG